MPHSTGRMPDGGFSPLAPELLVTDLDRSLQFWCDLVGFSISYRRADEGFVYLQHPGGAQVMLSRRNGAWESGPLEVPYGRGVLFQIVIGELDPVIARSAAMGQPLHMPLREVWRAYGDCEGGRREIALQDPDGYLVLLCQPIGFRPLPA